MKWSWRLGTIAGIELKVHATFVLLLVWVGWAHWTQGRSISAALEGVLFILVLFACVVLHELGHALTARRYGIKTRDIVLLPIGGVARLERIPEEPIRELLVAIAGPAVNVVIATVLFLLLSATGTWEGLSAMTMAEGPFFARVMIANVVLVLFNLLPAFPMDGGRMLRAALAMRMDYLQATQIAANVGQGMAFLFGLVGLLWNPFLLFIAFFVWIGAAQESSLAQMKMALGGIPVKRLMITDFRALHPEETLQRAIELTLATTQRDFPVVEGDRVVGVLTQQKLIRGLTEVGRDAPVASVMERDFQLAELSEMIEPAFVRLQSCNCSTLPVTDAGRLVGLLTLENVGEFLSIQSALKG
ncbi:MAG TPA: site-2 protease family protein [Thermoanaerobaculia bacterium]|nr:site-2 protease family protein [Thermoanaerobaculia bacterium]